MKGRVKKIRKRIIAYVLTASMMAGMFVMAQPAEASPAHYSIVLESGRSAPSRLFIGHEYTFVVKKNVENTIISSDNAKFSSSDKAVASIGSSSGKIILKKPGTVKITAKSKKTGKTYASKTFKVEQRAESISTDQERYYIKNIGDTVRIKANMQPDTSVDRTAFYSDDENIVSVDRTSGTVTCNKYGKTTVSACAYLEHPSPESKIKCTAEVYCGYYINEVEPFADGKNIRVSFYGDGMTRTDFRNDEFTVRDTADKEYAVSSVKTDTETGEVIIGLDDSIPDGNVFEVICKATESSCSSVITDKYSPSYSDFTYTKPSVLIYNGKGKTATVTCSKDIIGDRYTVKYVTDDGNATKDAPVNVGTYDVYVYVASTEECKPAEIKLGTFEITSNLSSDEAFNEYIDKYYGEDVTLTVTSDEEAGASYQWYKDAIAEENKLDSTTNTYTATGLPLGVSIYICQKTVGDTTTKYYKCVTVTCNHTHNTNGFVDGGDGTHSKTCSVCGKQIGEKEKHDYSAEIVSEAARASEADCTKKSTYYYSCSACGKPEKNDDCVFESGDTTEHHLVHGACTNCMYIQQTNMEIYDSGQCGEQTGYMYLSDGTMVIYGKGAMKDYESHYYTPWQDYAQSISSVIIDKGVTTIGNNSFKKCKFLSELSIGEDVLTIGEGAFQDSTLETLNIPGNVKTIGSDAFYDCDMLSEVTLSEGIETIGESAFRTCTELGNVVVDEEEDRLTKETLVIPSSVKTIGKYAFQSCYNLKHVSISEGVDTIGEYAFYNCINLESVSIGEGVAAIVDSAFGKCSRLVTINIPSSAKVGTGVFDECDALWDDEGYIIIDGGLYNYRGDDKIVDVPEGVTYIGKKAFSYCTAEEVLLPDSLKVIDDDAFRSSSVKEIVIPESVESIGEGVFDYAYFLAKLYIPAGVKSIGPNLIFSISSSEERKVYYGGTKEQWVAAVGTSETNVSEDILCVGHSHSYSGSLTLEPTCDKGGYTYSVCQCGKKGEKTAVTQATGKHDMVAGIVCKNCGYMSAASSEVIVEHGECDTIHFLLTGSGLFVIYGEGTIPDAYNLITQKGFSLDYIKDKIKKIVIGEGITEIGATFTKCENLTEVSIPASVKTIGHAAFAYCSNLTTVSFAGDEADITIDEAAFTGCDNLGYQDGFSIFRGNLNNYSGEEPYVTVPDGVTGIGNYVFTGKEEITEIYLPEGVTDIGSRAFNYARNLTEIYLPKSLVNVGEDAFAGCSGLKKIWFGGTEEEWGTLYGSSNSSFKTATKDLDKVYNHTHKFINVTYAPNCTEDGYTIKRCECGCVKGAKTNYIPANGIHCFVDSIDKETHICDVCALSENHVFTEEGGQCDTCGICYSLATKGAHDFSQKIIMEAPTAEKDGVCKYACADCGRIKKNEVVAHTDNLDDNGYGKYGYGNDNTHTKVLTIAGAEKIHLNIVCETENGYDYVKIFEGNHPDYGENNEGALVTLSGEKTENEYDIKGDSVTIVFSSDDILDDFYGYYAVVSDSDYTESIEYNQQQCTVKLNANSESLLLNLSGGGSYNVNDTFSISAKSNSDWQFDGWYQGDTLLTKEDTYEGQITEDMLGNTQEFTAKYIHLTHTAGEDGKCSICGEPVFIIAGSILTDNGDSIEANMTGLAYYASNQEVVLTVPVITGYNFVGWYAYSEESGNKYTGEKLCTSRTYKFTAIENRDLVAVYKPIGSAELTINGGRNFTINGDNKIKKVTEAYPMGSKIMLVCNDSDFGYWKNSAGMVLSRDSSYSFTVTGKETISAVFNTIAKDKATVVFESCYGQVISRDQYASGATITEPGLPFLYGQKALGWDYDGDGAYDVTKDTFAKALERAFDSNNKLVTILPVYQPIETTYNINVDGGTGTGNYKQNDVVTVVANAAPEGKKFSHWKDGAETILSYNEKYQFYAAKDMTVTAVYVEDNVKVEAKGTTEIIDKSVDTKNGKLIFVSMSTVPEGCTIDKAGIIATNDESVGTSGEGFNASTAKIVRGNAWTGNAYRYTWNKKNVSVGDTWYVRAYLVYTDAEGNVNTVYGKIESLTMGE